MSGMNPMKAIETLEKYRDLLPMDAQEAVDYAEYCIRHQMSDEDESSAVEADEVLKYKSSDFNPCDHVQASFLHFAPESVKPVHSLRFPKKIALLKICGALEIHITEATKGFIKPTPEQIKNLKEMLCIDVELLEDEKDGEQDG